MSIATEITRLQTAKANLKTSLEAKGATIASDATIDTYPTVLDDIPVCILQDKQVTVSAGSTTTISPDNGYTGLHEVEVTTLGALEEKDVNFYDFEGTLVASYTGTEIQELNSLPEPPDHSLDTIPLTFYEWNWTLSQIKSYNTSHPDITINVGACYYPTDDYTHLVWKVPNANSGLVRVCFASGYQGNIDWGDGNTQSIGSAYVTHTYSSPGIYDCKISNSAGIRVGDTNVNRSTAQKLIEFYLSRYGSITSNAFLECTSLKKITLSQITGITGSCFTYSKLKCLCLPSSINSSENYAFSASNIDKIIFSGNNFPLSAACFRDCSSLSNITLYNSQSTGSGAFGYCKSLSEINISNAESLGTYTFQDCHSLQEFTIPETMTSIGDGCFSNCYLLNRITLLPTTPPTLGSSVFDTNYLFKIYVPYSSDHSVLAAYQSATNWSAYASIMEELPS